MAKGGFMKDACILFAITLVAGACLGGVYEMTKGPIAAANQAAKEAAYRVVLADAASFQADDFTAAMEKANAEVAGLGFGNVTVDECATGLDASGAILGYAVTASSNDGYGGKITVSVVTRGPAWWWCDHHKGIKEMLDSFSYYSVLSTFIGMTTDSRSLLSLVRHDYFRRVLCSYIEEKVQDGTLPDSEKILSEIVRKMCYENALNLIK